MKAEVVREVATVKVLEAVVGKPACGREVIRILERAASAAGEWPMVLASDNGAEYVSAEVEQCLQSHQVMHLRSATHTPQHNAWAERAIGELKDQAEAERAPPCEDVFEMWQVRMHKAKRRLNENRLRASRGYRTAEELDKITKPGRLEPLRERFYRSAWRGNCARRDRRTQRPREAPRRTRGDSLDNATIRTDHPNPRRCTSPSCLMRRHYVDTTPGGPSSRCP